MNQCCCLSKEDALDVYAFFWEVFCWDLNKDCHLLFCLLGFFILFLKEYNQTSTWQYCCSVKITFKWQAEIRHFTWRNKSVFRQEYEHKNTGRNGGSRQTISMWFTGANNIELSQISFAAMSFNNLGYLFIALLMKYENSSLGKKKIIH